jgi:UDP-glucose 4-epimerase
LNASGASYIDSLHMVKLLVNDDYCVIILDSLSTGHVEVASFWRLITGACDINE